MRATGHECEPAAGSEDDSDGTPRNRQDSFDFLTFGRTIERKAEGLYEWVKGAYGEIVLLATDFHWESALDIIDHELEVPTSTDELETTLREISAIAVQLAEDVTTLDELRRRHLAERVAVERGR